MKSDFKKNLIMNLYTGLVIGFALVLQYFLMMYVMNPIILWLVM